MICVFHGLLYIANTNSNRVPDTTRKCCQCFTNKVLLGIGLFSCFCLSWVGAICDADTDPLCLGNNTIHSACAVLFFALTDVIALVLVCQPKTEKARRPTRRVFNACVALLMSFCTLVRACRVMCEHNGSSWGPQDGDNLVIIAEVIEVTLFVIFMNNTAWDYFDGLSWAAVSTPVDPDAPNRTEDVGAYARKLAAGSTALVVGTLATTLLIGALDGTLPAGQVPTLSDLGTHKPCNWIWRWAFVQAASAGLWAQGFAQVAVAGGSPSAADVAFLVVGTGALLCLAGMAIINQDEEPTYHAWLSAGFFALGDVYALGVVVLDDFRRKRKAKQQQQAAASAGATAGAAEAPLAPVVCAAVATLSALRAVLPFLGGGGSGSPSTSLSNAAAVLEWVNMLALAAFFYTNCASRDDTAQMSLSFLIDVTEQPQQKNKAARQESGVVVSSKTVGLV